MYSADHLRLFAGKHLEKISNTYDTSIECVQITHC